MTTLRIVGILAAMSSTIIAANPSTIDHHNGHKYSAVQARSIALKKYKGVAVGKVALEDQSGSWVYAVNVRSGRTEREVLVDADSGTIEKVQSKVEPKMIHRSKSKSVSHPHKWVRKSTTVHHKHVVAKTANRGKTVGRLVDSHHPSKGAHSSGSSYHALATKSTRKKTTSSHG